MYSVLNEVGDQHVKAILTVAMQVERLQRDTDAYTCYAMAAFSAEIAAGVPVLLQKVSQTAMTQPYTRCCVLLGLT